jgi:hypothetical protein
VVDVTIINRSTREIKADLDAINQKLNTLGEEESTKKFMGAAATAVAILAAILLILYRRTFD